MGGETGCQCSFSSMYGESRAALGARLEPWKPFQIRVARLHHVSAIPHVVWRSAANFLVLFPPTIILSSFPTGGHGYPLELSRRFLQRLNHSYIDYGDHVMIYRGISRYFFGEYQFLTIVCTIGVHDS